MTSTNTATKASDFQGLRVRAVAGQTDKPEHTQASEVPSRNDKPKSHKHSQNRVMKYLSKRQQKFPARVLGTLAAIHFFFPQARPYTGKFFFIQGVDSATGLARSTTDDAYFVFSWILVLTFARAFFLENVFFPIGKRSGIRTLKFLTRFAEQGWSLTYWLSAWVWGISLLSRSEYATNLDMIWIGWPHYQISKEFKSYYLIQLACWFCQIFVLNLEKPRADHYQMFTHHIVTCCLITGSFYYHFSRVGHVILLLMDNVDAWLAIAKMLKYLGYELPCDIMFGVFVTSWVFCRHFVYNYVLYSATYRLPAIVTAKCYYDNNGELIRCFSPRVQQVFLALLVGLQIITICWLYLIFKVIAGILRGGSPEDNRSEDEDSDDDDVDDE